MNSTLLEALVRTASEAVRTGGVIVPDSVTFAHPVVETFEVWEVKPAEQGGGLTLTSQYVEADRDVSCVGMCLRWGRMTSLAWAVVRR